MPQLKYKLLVSGILILFSVACSPQRDLVYFSDISQDRSARNISDVSPSSEPVIQQNDVIDIAVTSLSPESNAIFNVSNLAATPSSAYSGPYVMSKLGYKVDRDGFVGFPVLGRIKLAGLTTAQAEALITKQLTYYVKSPIVSVAFLNFKITVIGEVNHPGTFNITSGDVNVLEALGLAGDMTPFGKRDNVLLVRQVNGKRTIVRINLNNSRVFDSPYFYMKQNDVMYVEPDKAKNQQTNQNNRFIPIIAASATIIAVMLNILLKK